MPNAKGTRARNGNGSVAWDPQRKLWIGRIRIRGKVSRASAKTQTDCDKKLRDIRDAAEEGRTVPKARYTVAKLMTDWLNAKQADIKPQTWLGYKKKTIYHIIPSWGTRRLADLTPGEITTLLARKVAAGLSPRTASHVRAILRNALAWGITCGLTNRNVAQLAKSPKITPKRIDPLTPEQVGQLMSTLVDDRLEALYLLEIALGLRPGELLGLTWPCVDLAKGTVEIRNTLHYVDHKFLLLPSAKTVDSAATLFAPPYVCDALRQHRIKQDDERLVSSQWNDWDLVFTAPDGSPLTDAALYRDLQHRLVALAIPRHSFYSLRHTSASLLIEQGAEMKDVMEHLRHSQIALSMNTYGHLFESRKRATADRMDAWMRKATPEPLSTA